MYVEKNHDVAWGLSLAGFALLFLLGLPMEFPTGPKVVWNGGVFLLLILCLVFVCIEEDSWKLSYAASICGVLLSAAFAHRLMGVQVQKKEENSVRSCGGCD